MTTSKRKTKKKSRVWPMVKGIILIMWFIGFVAFCGMMLHYFNLGCADADRDAWMAESRDLVGSAIRQDDVWDMIPIIEEAHTTLTTNGWAPVLVDELETAYAIDGAENLSDREYNREVYNLKNSLRGVTMPYRDRSNAEDFLFFMLATPLTLVIPYCASESVRKWVRGMTA